MADNIKLKHVVAKIAAGMGRADRTAHKVGKAGAVAKKEFAAISEQVRALKRQLQKNTEGLTRALR